MRSGWSPPKWSTVAATVVVAATVACAGSNGEPVETATRLPPILQATTSAGIVPTSDAPTGPAATGSSLDLTVYANYDEVAPFLEGLGAEKPYPPELLDDAPELPKEEAAALWAKYLANTRVFVINPVTSRVERVQDLCANQTGTFQYHPQGWLEGLNFAWDFAAEDHTEWNHPRFVVLSTGIGDFSGSPLAELASVLAGGSFSASPSTSSFLGPQDEGGLFYRDATGRSGTARIFANEGCSGVTPILAFSAAQWHVLRLGGSRQLPPQLQPGSPQLDHETVVTLWTEFLADTTWFSNLNHTPDYVICRDRTGITVSRYESPGAVGNRFIWEVVDLRELAPNAVRFVGLGLPFWGLQGDIPANVFQFPLVPELFTGDYRGLVAVNTPGCSVEDGVRYLQESGILQLRCLKVGEPFCAPEHLSGERHPPR